MDATILDYLGVSKDTEVSFLDHVLTQEKELVDKRLFIHPDYLNSQKIEMFNAGKAIERVGSFLNSVLWNAGTGDLSEKRKQVVLNELFSYFQEIKELGLGYSKKANIGHGPEIESLLGIGKAAQELMQKWQQKDVINNVEAFKILQLYVNDFGPDALSDLTASLILPELVNYTKNVLDDLGVVYDEVEDDSESKRNYWDSEEKVWKPFRTKIMVKDLSIILVPYKLLVKSADLINPLRFVCVFLLTDMQNEDTAFRNIIKSTKGGKRGYMKGKSAKEFINKNADKCDKALTRYLQDSKVKGKKEADKVNSPFDF